MEEGGNIAIVGAGKGGMEFLKHLLKIPSINIKYVCDINPNACGLLYAKEYKIKCINDMFEIINDKDITLIFEITGKKSIFQKINQLKSPDVSLVGSQGTKTIFSLIDSYNEINESLKSYKIGLEQRIISRTEELEKANIELEKEKRVVEQLFLDQQKIVEERSKYLLHTTHQLKAPFAAIQNYVDIILDGYAGEIPKQTHEILQKVSVRCTLLTNVINEMLELAKLRSCDEDDIKKKNVNLVEVLLKVTEEFKIIADSQNVELKLNYSDESIIFYCNENQMNALFSILIENAINYSKPNSIVEINVKKLENNKLQFEVIDAGIGINEKNISKIFKEYFRANNATDFRPNGTGLGLALVKEIANFHQLKIEVKSKLNEGTKFLITS